MALDLAQVAQQIGEMAPRLAEQGAEERRHLAEALALFQEQVRAPSGLETKLAGAKTTWLVAGLSGETSPAYASPALPEEYAVVAADGSHIDVDRHAALSCFLLNIGWAVLGYGAAPCAHLESEARLFWQEEDLVFRDSTGLQEVVVEGSLLGVKRTVEEGRRLAEVASSLPTGPALALMDGSLILWSLAGKEHPAFVKEELLRRGFLPVLDRLKVLSSRPLALAGYISRPGSREVVNLLRIALCPYQPVNCDLNCGGKRGRERPCNRVGGLADRHLFTSVLSPGQRSPLFVSRSSIVREFYGEHQICFFYLHTGEEVARVELPRWCAQDGVLLGLAHSLVVDQGRRGLGYPEALMEAHEQAVVGGEDREAFWRLMEAALEEAGREASTSLKRQSKRLRWL